MSFRQRAIRIRFILVDSGGNEVIDLTDHRCDAIVQNPGGGINVGMLQLRVYGMKQTDMNILSTNGLHPLAVKQNEVFVSAGDVGGNIQQIFSGTINAAYVDYSDMPNVSFNVQAVSGFYHQIAPIAPNSYKGAVDVASVIQSITKSMGFAFQNNGVTAKVKDQYLPGTAIQQIKRIAEASSTIVSIENNTVTIWPNGSYRDSDVVDISPSTGMVGYPMFTPYGITVKHEFNPHVVIGRKVNVTSSEARASGGWATQFVTHELSTLAPNGPWFTTMNLTENTLYVSWN